MSKPRSNPPKTEQTRFQEAVTTIMNRCQFIEYHDGMKKGCISHVVVPAPLFDSLIQAGSTTMIMLLSEELKNGQS